MHSPCSLDTGVMLYISGGAAALPRLKTWALDWQVGLISWLPEAYGPCKGCNKQTNHAPVQASAQGEVAGLRELSMAG